jgi:hypothetical protein
MPDDFKNYKDNLVRFAGRMVEQGMASRGILYPKKGTGHVDAFGVASQMEGFETFASGYDSGTGETVMPFMLDFSLLDGDDRLV